MSEAWTSASIRRSADAAVRRFMDQQGLWPPNGRMLVAVSGGPDSTALLLILVALSRKRPLDLTLAYFDHALRDASERESEADAVRDLAASLGLRLRMGSGEVRSRAARDRLSLEDAARRERYAFLSHAAREAGCESVATGHTASDQAETVLLHLIRGAGLGGLGGIQPLSVWPFPDEPGLRLVRPLLELSREETRSYCKAAGLRPVEDSTNASMAFQRNRLRHEVLPLLRGMNPGVDAALIRLANAARDDQAYIESVAAQAVETSGGEGIVLTRSLLAGWPAALRHKALHQALGSLAGDAQGFSERHILALERLIVSGRTGDGLDLPRGIQAHLTRDTLSLRSGRSESAPSLGIETLVLSIPGEARLGGLVISASAEAAPKGAVSAVVDAEATGEALIVRQRRPGDRFQPLGMSKEKKLQDFLVDAHVPREERDSLPIFESPRGILWVGGQRIAEWAKPRPDRRSLVLAYRSANRG